MIIQRMVRSFHMVVLAAFSITALGCTTLFFPDDGGGFFTWYVPDDFPTIQEAIDYSVPGDLVLVRSGVYSPSTNGEIFPIFLQNGVDVIGENPANTIVDAQSTNYVFDVFRFDSLLMGFTVVGGIANSGGGLFIEDSQGVIQNLNVIGNRSEEKGSGIFIASSLQPLLQNIVVAHNVRTNAATNPAQVELLDSDIDFFNNVIANGDSDGLRINPGSFGFYENNIFFQNGSDGFGVGFADEGADPSGIVIEYNMFFDNFEADFFIADQLRSAAEANDLTPDIFQNFSADPLFTNPAADDYTLLPGSPAFHAGNPDPYFNNPDGSRNDIGAYGGPAAVEFF